MQTYDQFREEWLKKHPASMPEKPEIVSEYPNWVKLIVGAMFFASAVISGVHTAPTVRLAIEKSVAPLMADFAAAMSFVAVELALFVSAYLRHKNRGLAITILITTMIVAVAANIVSVSKAMADSVAGTDSTGAGVVAIILGVAIPVITLAAGEMFVHITSAGRSERIAAERQYRDDLKQLDATILRAYSAYEKDVSVHRLSGRTDGADTRLLSVSGVSDQTADRQTALPAASGFNRTPDGQRKVIEWLDKYPDDIGLSSGKLMRRMEEHGVTLSRDTVWRGQTAWSAARAAQLEDSSNGTGE